MRARYLLERDKLLKLGASDVIAEEVEGAVEAVARMLRWLGVPGNAIDERVRAIRAETKTTDRRQVLPTARLGHFRELGDLRVESAIVGQKSKAAHASPASLNLRSDTGALAIGIRRAGELLDGIDAHAPFLPGDVVYLVGSKDALARAFAVMANES
jgi:CPA2 family monovalent cation:H+ antiporter-2